MWSTTLEVIFFVSSHLEHQICVLNSQIFKFKFKNLQMTSNVDMIDTKVVVAEVIYNFEVDMFFIWGQLYSQIFILSLCILKFNF
jgi:hypothetical protein